MQEQWVDLHVQLYADEESYTERDYDARVVSSTGEGLAAITLFPLAGSGDGTLGDPFSSPSKSRYIL